jgi:hypothetical protein
MIGVRTKETISTTRALILMGTVVPWRGGIKARRGPSLLSTQRNVHIRPLSKEVTA